MYEAIEELYLSAGRVKDIFDLRLHDGKLEQALGLMLLQLDMEQFASVPKEKLDLLIDFVVLGRLIENARRKEEVQLSMLYDLQKLAEYGYGSRIQEWELALEILKNGIQAPTSRSRNIEDQRIKFVAALQVHDIAAFVITLADKLCRFSILSRSKLYSILIPCFPTRFKKLFQSSKMF